jgi:hypothetical protein
MVVSFIGGRNQSIGRKPPTCHKSLTYLPHNVVSIKPRHERIQAHIFNSGDRIVSQNVLKFYQQLTGEERRVAFIFGRNNQ